jgi:predicted Zn-dependent protease
MRRGVFVLSLCGVFVCACADDDSRRAAETSYISALEAYTEQDFDRALDFTRKAVSLNKRFYQASFLEAKILFFTGKESEARTVFARLVKRYPRYLDARIWYIRCLILGADYDEAVAELDSELSFNTSDWRIYYLYALLGQKTENYEQRLAMNRRAEAALADSAKVYADLASTWRALGLEERAEEYFGKAAIISGLDAPRRNTEE